MTGDLKLSLLWAWFGHFIENDAGYVNTSQNRGLFYYVHLFIYNIAFHLWTACDRINCHHTHVHFREKWGSGWCLNNTSVKKWSGTHMRFTSAMPRLHPACFCHFTNSPPSVNISHIHFVLCLISCICVCVWSGCSQTSPVRSCTSQTKKLH